jgi:hypothetical protein
MAEGIKATSARWGAAFTPYLIVSLYRFFTWRETFVLFGAIGVIWAAAFYWWYRDDPAEYKAELAEVTGGAPWRKFLWSRSAWAPCIQWFCHYYGFSTSPGCRHICCRHVV